MTASGTSWAPGAPPRAEVPEADLRAALDRIVADALPAASGLLGLLLLFFAAADPFIYPGGWPWLSLVDAVAGLGFLAVYAVVRRKGTPPRHAHPYVFLLSMLVLANVEHDLLLLGDPEQALYLILLVAGAGTIMLSLTWLVPVLVLTMGGFLVAAFAAPEAHWTNFGFALFAACVLSFLVHSIRVRTYRRLEVLRLAAEKAGNERDMREQALEAAVQSAWESEERYRRLVEQAPDGFLVISDGRVVYANAAAVRLYGASRADDLLGRDPISLVHPEDAEVARRRISQIVDGGRPTQLTEMRIVRMDGTPLDVEVMGQPIQYLGKTADQTIIRDISDRKRAESERRLSENRLAEIARLKEMDHMKTQFVNTLSHELRTPLTPIKIQLHLLKNAIATGDKEKHRKAQEMLERNFGRMSSLVDELLEVARLQAGTLKLDVGPVELDQVVHETLESFHDVAKANGVEVQAKLAPGLRVEADPKRITQVMYNLLNNALKFTPKGGRIAVEARAGHGHAIVSVTDSGVGLKKEDIARLFEPFSQVHDTMQKTNAGTGLGLYICKGIVEGHKGRIWCDSPGHGKGATFAFELPLGQPA